jgi:Flp pilus assembly pilin Flp
MDMRYTYRKDARFPGISFIKESKDEQMRTVKDIYKGLYKEIFNVLYSEKGQTIIEYALVIALVSIALIIALSSAKIDQGISNAASKVASSVG